MVREASEAGVNIGSSGAVVGRERCGRGKQKGGGGRGVIGEQIKGLKGTEKKVGYGEKKGGVTRGMGKEKS